MLDYYPWEWYSTVWEFLEKLQSSNFLLLLLNIYNESTAEDQTDAGLSTKQHWIYSVAWPLRALRTIESTFKLGANDTSMRCSALKNCAVLK